MRIDARLPLRIRKADASEHVDDPRLGLFALRDAVANQNALQLAADAQVRVQGLHRILEHHCHAPRPQIVQRGRARAYQFDTIELRAALHDRGR